MRDRAWLLVMALAAGCVDPATVTCNDGTLCPGGRVCHEGGRCLLPEQLTACGGLADNELCDLGPATGECRLGVCEIIDCGDAVVDIDEACDDGNRTSGDGCRADCAKIELCGDGLLDQGEGCDDANENAADGCDACVATQWTATPLIGGNHQAVGSDLVEPWSVAFDAVGNMFLADRVDHRVLRVQAGTGLLTVVAGTGVPGLTGDGGPATSAQLREPTGVAVDALGNVYIADRMNHRVRKVEANTGVITTVAGSAIGSGGENVPATVARLNTPTGVAVDGLGNLFIADTDNSVIRRVDQPSGIITTYAGSSSPGFEGDGGEATDAMLSGPTGVALDASGNLFIADTGNHRIRRVSAASAVITTVAGSGAPASFFGENIAATAAKLNFPHGVAVDAAGNLYIADRVNDRIRRVSGGTITTVVGTGEMAFGGDTGAATAAKLWEPRAVAFDPAGAMYIADTVNRRIRRVDAGTITTFAGRDSSTLPGDGRSALSALIGGPVGVAIHSSGEVYFADTAGHSVRRIESATGDLFTVAGIGSPAAALDGGLAAGSPLNRPTGIAFDAAGNLLIADSVNHRVRRVDATTKRISTIAGTGTCVPTIVENVDPTTTSLCDPQGLAVTTAGEVLIADAGHHRIRKISATAPYRITTVAGTGAASFSDGPVATAGLSGPLDVAVDAQGTVWIADTGNHRIRKLATGVVSTVAGTGVPGTTGDGMQATAALLSGPSGVAVDALGNVYIADMFNDRIRRIDAITKVIQTVVGTGTNGASGDGGLVNEAALNKPHDLVLDANGVLVFSDRNNARVRRVSTTNIITSIVGNVDPDGMGPIPLARLTDARALVIAAPFTLFAGGSSGALQAVRTGSGRVEVVAGRYKHGVDTPGLARFQSSSFGPLLGVEYDPTDGRIFVSNAAANRVEAIVPVDLTDENTWTMSTLGGFNPGYLDGPTTMARFREPAGLYLDVPTRTLYVADKGNHLIRAIDLLALTVRTIAGRPFALGYGGDGQLATSALLNRPVAITRCPNGDLFIADNGNHRVRRVAAVTGVMSTVLGDGSASSAGQGGPSSGFPVSSPLGLACDATGNLFVSSATTIRLLPADGAGVVDGTGSVQTIFGAPPRTTFPATVTFCLSGVAIVSATKIQVTDACNGMLIELEREPVP